MFVARVASVGMTYAVVSATYGLAPTDVTWDANPAAAGIQDGSGAWDTQGLNFHDPLTGTNDAFDNAARHEVTFGAGGNGSLVTLAAGSGIRAHGLTFNPTAAVAGYQISAAAGTALTFVGSASLTASPSDHLAYIRVSNANSAVQINAPLVLDGASTTGLTLDPRSAADFLAVTGTITTAGHPITVQGAGIVVLKGQIIGGTTLTKSSAGPITIGDPNVGINNSGVALAAKSGTTTLNAVVVGPTYYTTVDTGTDIAVGATVKLQTTAVSFIPRPFSLTSPTLNVSISPGGTLDLNRPSSEINALAGGGTVAGGDAA